MTDKMKKRKAVSPDRTRVKRGRKTVSDTPTDVTEPSAGLPTSTDYGFRLDVICTPNINQKIFKGAVHGLIEICFPDSILDELRVGVIEAHMREGHALEENVVKMRELWKSAMIHRVSWMLARYLDQPGNMQTAFAAIAAAREAIHGKLGAEDDGDGHDAEAEGESEADEEIVSDIRASVEDCNLREASAPRKLPRPSVDKRKGKKSGKETCYLQEENNDPDEDAVATSPNAPDARRTTNNKAKKASKTWRWDVEAGTVTLQQIPEYFGKVGDLFAFHALPVVKRKLGPTTEKKLIRQSIDTLIADIPDEEWKEWVLSFRKLIEGDLSMLDRADHDETAETEGISRATPAPVLNRQRRDVSPRVYDEQAGDRILGIKFEREGHADSEEAEVPLAQSVPLTQDEPRNDDEGVQEPQPVAQHSIETPIVDLLWGKAPFLYHDQHDVTRTIMENLQKRIRSDSIIVQWLLGPDTTRTKNQLRIELSSAFPVSADRYRYHEVREAMDKILIPWVSARPASFWEIIGAPIFFTDISIRKKPLQQLLIGGNCNQIGHNREFAYFICKKLRRRGIPERFRCSRSSVVWSEDIHNILGLDIHITLKRGFLERILREVAFFHRDKFPEISSSKLV
ncbi:hypothetical protein CC80DRAFT_598952 [Byssothecium circinans]|uniref:Uncharacterized protein n=1 Tax=Byssothecium circinans TaxID=147558 RepID=A0A6A5T9L1_9PLEO|nr:hypothetical protein CC80DRAFT_598952 [Byssothecium circinans]